MNAPLPDAASAEVAAAALERARAKRRAQTRAAVLRQVVQWHWISAAVCLAGMLLFAITGITLNHAGDIKAEPKTVTRDGELPADLLGALKAAEAAGGDLPAPVRAWLASELKVKAPAGPVEWSPGEAYVALPGPGSDGWVTLESATGAVAYERTERGWVAYLNDLHKGRNTGKAWAWFIDIFAVACVLFSVTGLLLLQLHAHARKSTWPLVGLGLLVPVLLALFLIH
ncbi:PepSY-associated TM helix domain-containing protein [Phenylobacterium sp. VNQ135]|uniref:PepSY-associated TM helix domain-containing protein n=1 Tax=Phenylobacterium sp. VNQ135 TaxID=3400922 RepID=UPI003C02F210